jgi:hypothetical protein
VRSLTIRLVDEPGQVDRLVCLALDDESRHTVDVTDVLRTTSAVRALGVRESVLAEVGDDV